MSTGARLIDRLRDHMTRGVPVDMRETVKYDDTPGPPRLDPVANMRDVTEASVQHHGILVAMNEEISSLNAQCGDLRKKDREQTQRAEATDLALSRLRRLLLTMAGVQTIVALCLLTGALVLVYALLTKYPAWKWLPQDPAEQQDGEGDGIRTRDL